MNEIAPCVICSRYIYYKNTYCCNYNWCDNCVYNLQLFNNILCVGLGLTLETRRVKSSILSWLESLI